MGRELVVHFLEVGQSDGVYIEFPDGATNALIDLGTTRVGPGGPLDVAATLADSPWLQWFSEHPNLVKDSGELTYLVFTNGAVEHYNLVLPFLDHVRTTLRKDLPAVTITWVLHGGARSDFSELPEAAQAELDDAGGGSNLIAYLEAIHRPDELGGGAGRCDHLGTIVPLSANPDGGEAASGDAAHDDRADGGATLTVVANSTYRPLRGSTADGASDRDDGSLVLMLDFAGVKILLTGQASSLIERQLMNPKPSKAGMAGGGRSVKDVDVLRVSSRTAGSASTPEFIGHVNPRVGILSAGGADDADGARSAPSLAVVDTLACHGRLRELSTTEHSLTATHSAHEYGVGSDPLPPGVDPWPDLRPEGLVTARTTLPIFGGSVRPGAAGTPPDFGTHLVVTIREEPDATAAGRLSINLAGQGTDTDQHFPLERRPEEPGDGTAPAGRPFRHDPKVLTVTETITITDGPKGPQIRRTPVRPRPPARPRPGSTPLASTPAPVGGVARRGRL